MSKDNLLRMAGAAAVTCLAMAGFGANADAAQVLTAVTAAQGVTGQVIGAVTVGVDVTSCSDRPASRLQLLWGKE